MASSRGNDDTSKLEPRAQFAALFADDSQAIDLIEAALLIAAEHHPEFDLADCHRQIEQLATEAREHIDFSGDARSIGEDLCKFMYRQAKYNGDHADYYNPDNSYLDRVLKRRKGIPITLALVYISVGRQLGLQMEPVGFPGHFLVKLIGDDTDVILDPFSAQLLSEDDCKELLKTCTQGQVSFKPAHLDTTDDRDVVRRILGNLKGIYLNRKEMDEALAVCDQLLLISKNSPRDILDRAYVLEQMDCHAAAIQDLEHLLSLAPPPHVSQSIREKIANLKRQNSGQLH